MCFCYQICLGKKKQLVVLRISEEKLVVEKIRDLPDVVTAVVLDGAWACVALQGHYVVCNVETGESQDLFPFEEAPVLARVAKVRSVRKLFW